MATTKPNPKLAYSTVTVRARWTPPCIGEGEGCGSPAVAYVMQMRHQIDGNTGDWFLYATAIEDTVITVTLPLFTPTQVRVAGIDAQNRQGPWSAPCEWYTGDFGPPGQPTTPEWDTTPPSDR